MSITAQDVLRKHPREQVINAIGEDKTFHFSAGRITIEEVEKFKYYKYDLYQVTREGSKYLASEDIIIEDAKDGLEWHKMYKKPQDVYVAIYTQGVDLQIIIHHETGASAYAAIALSEKIIDAFLTCKKIEKVEEMDHYMDEYDRRKRGEKILQKKITEFNQQPGVRQRGKQK